MKKLAILAAIAALSGCASQQPGPANYGTRASTSYTYSQPDANGWRTVSVTDVNLPPDAPRPANVTSEPLPATTQAQANVVYQQQPVVVERRVYTQPVYVEEPYYYSPAPVLFSFGLGLWLGNSWNHGYYRGHWRAPYHRR